MRSVLIGSILSGACVALFFACNSTEAGSEFQDSGTTPTEAGPGFDADFIGEGGDALGSDSSEPPNACGNGVKNPETEICDDGNKADGDGCTAKCRVEPGWVCPIPGAKCTAIKCGDSVIAGDEDCDDGNANDADGCSSKCRIEVGYKCGAPGTPCEKTTCGDNKKEEQTGETAHVFWQPKGSGQGFHRASAIFRSRATSDGLSAARLRSSDGSA